MVRQLRRVVAKGLLRSEQFRAWGRFPRKGSKLGESKKIGRTDRRK